MKIKSISFKNLFAYGEEINTINYSDDGKLILLSGISGAGKSSLLNLPILLLYGKVGKISKTAIANRINKNGWIKGEIRKGAHDYIIERTFMPNSIKVFKDGIDIENFGSNDAQDYINNEIIEIPQATFANLISTSMKNFKSFLTMSPSDRKQIIDRCFSLEVINIVFENIKKDLKEIGNTINADNSTIYSLNISLTNSNNELIKIQDELKSEDNQKIIDENNKKIKEINNNIDNLNTNYKKIGNKEKEINDKVISLNNEILVNNMNIKQIEEKINLFGKEKCPTCGTPFSSDRFIEIKEKLNILLENKKKYKKEHTTLINDLKDKLLKIKKINNKINDNIYKLNLEINKLNTDNRILLNKIQSSTEYQAIKNIIDKTTKQINDIKKNIEKNTKKLLDLQILQSIYSIDGVKKQVINNYLPLLNKEISENLNLLNFPYQLSFNDKFEPTLSDLGKDIQIETLSDGEMTRVDLVILCSLFKLLKRRYPTINIFSIDETISTLDTFTSKIVLKFLKDFAKEMNLCCIIVSHTDLNLEEFDEIIEITKEKGFSKIYYRNI